MMTPMGSLTPDPFGTAGLRRAVLDTWAASPARFREDANAEEELVRGAYRDRVVIELAQNAADAAVAAGVSGRLLLRHDGRTMRIANTGAPLDAAGVEGLATLRASAKRDGSESVGRFGVGFAAVLAVTDRPEISSRTGGVRWARAESAELAAAVPALSDELARRGNAVPVLRLPLPGGGDVPAGYDTEVVLPLRDEAASRLADRLIEGVDDALLLALPAIAEVVVETAGKRRVLTAARRQGDATVEVVVSDGGRRTYWRLAERTGRVPVDLLADRPVEEPDRWSVVVAVPFGPDRLPEPLPASVPRTVHAPTPTDDRTDLPALVLASFPLDSSRRRIVPGALTDLIAGEVASAYASLARTAATAPGVLRLVPGPLPVSEVDGALHRAVVAALAGTPLVPPASGGPDRLAPRDVVLVDGLAGAADPAALARFVPGLPEPSWWRPDPLRRLGARTVSLADVVDELANVSLEPAEWRDLYGALDGADREALATLPVPLDDGRVVRGARGVLLPTTEVEVRTLAPLGLRIVAPEAVHPLLTRLGAVDATAAGVLRDPLVHAAVLAADEAVSDAVLYLVEAARVTVEDEPWLAELPLPDGTGGTAPAGQLWLPDAPVLDLFDVDRAEHIVAGDVLRRWGRQVLQAVGVRDGFGVFRAADVALDPEAWHDLDDEGGWIEAVLDGLPDQGLPPVAAELVAVRDLDLVHEACWPQALELLLNDPRTRPAVVEAAHVLLADGSRRPVRSYTSWWLRTNARIAGWSLSGMCTADADPIVRRLLRVLPVELDGAAVRSLGLVRTIAELAGEPALLLDRLGDPSIDLTARELSAVYAALEATKPDPDRLRPPDAIRIPAGDGSRLAAAQDVVVADGPQWLQLDLPAVLPGTTAVADLLDLPLAAAEYDSRPSSQGTETAVPGVAARMLPAVPSSYVEHDDLIVAGRSVDWWVDEAGTVHAATLDGLARGLAWTAGRWDLRLELTEALRDPDAASALLAERAFT
jgi:hypothetical protein